MPHSTSSKHTCAEYCGCRPALTVGREGVLIHTITRQAAKQKADEQQPALQHAGSSTHPFALPLPPTRRHSSIRKTICKPVHGLCQPGHSAWPLQKPGPDALPGQQIVHGVKHCVTPLLAILNTLLNLSRPDTLLNLSRPFAGALVRRSGRLQAGRAGGRPAAPGQARLRDVGTVLIPILILVLVLIL